VEPGTHSTIRKHRRWVIGAIVGVVATGAAFASCVSDIDEAPPAVAVAEEALWSKRWENLGGDVVGDPAVASWGSGQLDVFWRHSTARLHHRWYPHNGGWSWLQDIGSSSSSPGAVATDDGKLDVFHFNSSGNLVRRYFPNSSGGWGTENLPAIPEQHKRPMGPGQWVAGPTVASWGPGRLDVFWRGADNRLKRISRASSSANWSAIEDLPEVLASDPAAVSYAPGRIDVFWRSDQNKLRHKVYAQCLGLGCNPWSATTSVAAAGNTVMTAPDVASWEAGRLDVFWGGSAGQLLHTWRWPDMTWWIGGTENLGGIHAGGPAAVSWGPNRIDVFMKEPSANDVEHFVWEGANPSTNTPAHNDKPPAPTIIASNEQIATGNLWEFSSAASPPTNPACRDTTGAAVAGAVAISGASGGSLQWQLSPPTSTAAAQNVSNELSFGMNNAIESDNVMTRAPNGDLLLLRGVMLGTNCPNAEETGCTTVPGCAGVENRSGTALWRSTDCGANWTLDQGRNLVDPLFSLYGNGAYGGGPCWGGWDREEVYYDYWSDRLFVTYSRNGDGESNTADAVILRSASGTSGNGPYTVHRAPYWPPGMMTSLPGRLFLFTCPDSPTLRWIDPNSTWDADLSDNFQSWAIPGQPACAVNPSWPGAQGSESVTRVATYVDDLGATWWIVRVAFQTASNRFRVLTVRVGNTGSGTVLNTYEIAPLPQAERPLGQAGATLAQLTAIEPYPIFDSNQNWTGENTTLYYWREEYWDTPGGIISNQQNRVRAVAVRDSSGWGDPFSVGDVFNGRVTGQGPKPGDYVKGTFWYDSSAPETPLRYFVLRADIPANTASAKLRSTILAYPRGLGNQ
jgi:hypothetical protein